MTSVMTEHGGGALPAAAPKLVGLSYYAKRASVSPIEPCHGEQRK
jgi:hypothetical protein